MQNYFGNCQTLNEAKKLYYDLVMKLHPDRNGDEKKGQFQEMGAEYEAKVKYFKLIEAQFDGFQPKTEKFAGEQAQHNAAQYRQIIEDLLKIKGIIVEINGSFIWLSGDTKSNKEAIKAIKNPLFKPAYWCPTKLQWCFSPIGYKKKSNKTFTMGQIRNKYGSTVVTESGTKQETTQKQVH